MVNNDLLFLNLMNGRTKKYSAFELSQIMEEKGIVIAPASSADAFTISVKATKNEINDAKNTEIAIPSVSYIFESLKSNNIFIAIIENEKGNAIEKTIPLQISTNPRLQKILQRKEKF